MKVFLVGAGPGDPDLLTRKAERLLRTADVCIYAGSLVNPAVLEFLPQGAERHDSAKLTHPEIISLITEACGKSKTVVRLHSGDPSIYGAINEEISGLSQKGIACEVVPGVSSFQAAAAALKWELTLPGKAQSIVLTRTPGRTAVPEAESLENFAKTGATICLFLSAHAIASQARILAGHYGPDCPAAVVFHASWPDQAIITGTLSDIGEKALAAGITKTALFIVRREPPNTRSRLYDPAFSHGFRE